MFETRNARSKAFEDHKKGDVPFVSNGFANNGVVGFVQPIQGECVFNFKGICLSAFCEATVHEPPYLPRGNGGSGLVVLEPHEPMSTEELLFYSAYINVNVRWRFSFGRMVTKDRAKVLPMVQYDATIKCPRVSDLLPKTNPTKDVQFPTFAMVPLVSLFQLHSGDYHKASSLAEGDIPLISCGDEDNGVVRYVNVPEDKRYMNTLTIAYNGQPLTTKFHPYIFSAKDDVAVCIPKKNWRLSTLIFIQYMLNREQWRYSYGRKCFREKLERLKLMVPITSDGKIDEDAIQNMIFNTSYWQSFQLYAQRSVDGAKQSGIILSTFN